MENTPQNSINSQYNINNSEISPEELSYIQQILSSLEITYKYIDKETNKKAELFLKQAEESIFIHLIPLFSFIRKSNLTKELSNSLIIFIRNSIINKKKSNTLTKENYIELIMLIGNIIINPDYPSECMREMNKIFEEVINNKEFIKDKSIIQELMNVFVNKLEIGFIKKESYKSLSYIYENILNSACVDEKNCDFFINLIINCSEEMLKNIFHTLDNINISNTNNETEKIEIESNILYFLETIKVIYELILLVSVITQNQFNNFKKFEEKIFGFFLDMAIKMLSINYNKLFEAVIKMKIKILRFINSIMLPSPPLYSNEKILLEKNHKIITFCFEALKTQNFFIFNNKDVYKSSLIEKFDVQIIIYLCKMVFNSSFSNELTNYLSNITYNIIFPLLISTNEEIDNIEHDPDGTNYANFIYDLVTKKKLKQLKTTLAKFLSIGCNANEKYLQLIICYSIGNIQLCLKVPKEKLIEPSLMSNDNNYFFNNPIITEINKIEVSFLTLCIISKVILKKNNKIIYLKIILQFFQEYLKIILDKYKTSSIIKERITLFISLYIKEFIEIPIEINFFKEICEFLFSNIFKKGNIIAVYESFDAITKILSNKNFGNEISNFLSQKYENFIYFIEVYTNPLFFDVLLRTVKSIEDPKELLKILQTLFLRVRKEITPRRISQSNYNEIMQDDTRNNLRTDYRLIINKCFMVIHEIFTKSIFIQKYYNEFENFLSPLLKYLKCPNKIDFDDDLIKIIIRIIKELKYIPKLLLDVLPDLTQVIRKNKGLDIDLFILLNEYIFFSKGEIELEENAKIIFKLYKKCFVKESSYEESVYLGSLIIQIWFTISKNIPNTIICNILNFVNERLQKIFCSNKKNNSDMGKLTKFGLENLSLSLSNIIISSFINYPECAITLNNIKEIIQISSFRVSSKLLPIYENKIYVFGLCAILRNSNINKFFQEFNCQILIFCYNLLKKLKILELKKKSKKNILEHNNTQSTDADSLMKNIDNDSDNEYGNDNLDENYKKSKKIKKKREKSYLDLTKCQSYDVYMIYKCDDNFDYKIADENIYCPIIRNVDEFKYFEESVNIFQNQNKEMFEKFCNNLNNEEKIILEDIIKIKE